MTKSNEFSIKAYTYALKFNKDSKKDILLNEEIRYVIPVYQRPYSWSEEQITKFIADIFKSFYGYDKQSKPEALFIGTMQISGDTNKINNKVEQDVVDGQQRLTTLMLLLKELAYQFPEEKELKNINFDWLRTKVNSGEQQKYLSEFLEQDLSNISYEEAHNPYLKNIITVRNLLKEELYDEGENLIKFNIESFIKHFFSNIYFVVIETVAGLSKTLQIFDAINTTGLDLNGSDVFKIRMFEYLKYKQKQGDEAFETINKLYAKVDRYNRDFKHNISFSEVLGIYQKILISKYKLSVKLYSYGVDNFFEKLFDILLNINHWEEFKNTNELKLSLEEIADVIEARFKWENLAYPSFEAACSMNFIWWSRYSRFWSIAVLFLYSHGNDKDLFMFINRLSKLYLLYSVYFDKAIGNIYSFTYGLIDKIIIEVPFNDLIKEIEEKISDSVSYHGLKGRDVFISKLNQNIAYNAKKKNLICRLSAMLDEDYKSNNGFEDLTGRFFYYDEFPNDIEHIQSVNDENLEIREDVKLKWAENLDSIGNLILLERNINRSISNKVYSEKSKEYFKSKFKTVHKQILNYNKWTLEKCIERKESEIKKLTDYLFDNKK